MTEPFDNVARIGAPPRLKPRAEKLLGAIAHASDLAPLLDHDYLVKGWLDRGAISLIYVLKTLENEGHVTVIDGLVWKTSP